MEYSTNFQNISVVRRRAHVISRQMTVNKCVCSVQQRYGEAVCHRWDKRGDSQYQVTIIHKNAIQTIQRARSEHSVLEAVHQRNAGPSVWFTWLRYCICSNILWLTEQKMTSTRPSVSPRGEKRKTFLYFFLLGGKRVFTTPLTRNTLVLYAN